MATYAEVLDGSLTPGDRVAVIGAGGIGFDVASFLVHPPGSTGSEPRSWEQEWGICDPAQHRGGLCPSGSRPRPAARTVTLLQRRSGKFGAKLGKTTGWIHRLALHRHGVQTIGDVSYTRIDDDGLHIHTPAGARCLPVDHVVLCSGQTENRDLYHPLKATHGDLHLIGGAADAAGIDAKRAIDQGYRLAASL